MPLYDFSSGLAGLNAGIDNFSTALGNADKQNQLRQLGQKMSTGDYDGASVIAASLNDLPTMMKLQDLKQQGANRSDYQSRYVGPQPVGLESLATSAPAPAASLPSSSASPPTPSATPVGGISPLAPKAAQQFMSNGTITNPLGAAALAAGFQTESHYDPSQTAKGDGSDGSDSVNIGQWNGSRAIDFRNFYQANKLDPSDPQTGLAFSKYELQNKPEYAGVVQGLNAATTPEEANAAALGYFSPRGYTRANPQGADSWTQRLNYTKAIYGSLGQSGALQPQGQASAGSPPMAGANPVPPAGAPPNAPRIGLNGQAVPVTPPGGIVSGPNAPPLAAQLPPGGVRVASAVPGVPTPDTGTAQPTGGSQGGSQDAATALRQAGYTPAPESLFVASKIGIPATLKLLAADPSTPMSQILDPQMASTYPQLAATTTGNFYTAARRAVAGQPGAGAGAGPGQVGPNGAVQPQGAPGPSQAPAQGAPGADPTDPPVTIDGKTWTRAQAQALGEDEKGPGVGEVAEAQGIKGLLKNSDGEFDYEAGDIAKGLASGSLKLPAGAAPALGASSAAPTPPAGGTQPTPPPAVTDAVKQLPPNPQMYASQALSTLKPGSPQALTYFSNMVAAASAPGNEAYKEAAQKLLDYQISMAEQDNSTKDPDAARKLAYARSNWKTFNLPDPTSTDPAALTYWRNAATQSLTGGGQQINVVNKGEGAEAAKAGDFAATRMNTMMNDAESAPERIARMALLNNVLQNTATGPLAGPSGTVGRVALALGISPDTLKTLNIDPSQPTNNEIAQKLAGELVVGSIGAKNGGFPASNFSIAERQFIESMFPNIMNQPGSNQAVSDVLIAKDQRALQKAGEWRQFKNTARTGGQTPSYADFEDQWLENHQNDNVFQPIIDKFQAGGYGPPGAPPPAPGGALNAPASPAAPQAGSAAAAAPQLPAKAPLANGGQPMSPQDAAKLPKGSHFMGLDDQERIVR